MYNERIYRAFSSFNTFQSLLTHRDDGSHTPDELRLCATLDAWCYAPCYAERNARGAIFLGSLTSKLADSLCVDYPAQVTPPWSNNRRLF